MFLGKNRSGKTHISWAIYRHAVYQNRPATACLLRDLLADFRRVEVGVSADETLRSPRVSSNDLRGSKKRWLILLQEFEKARPTAFSAEMLFDLLDTARDYKHQVVITSNFNPKQLRDHWGTIDPVWGNSIMTRLQDCHEINFF